jgi:hypothetical protein
MRRLAVLILAAAALAACADRDADSMLDPVAASAVPNGYGPAMSATYEVTIENLTGGQPFTPALLATHRRPEGMFTVGQPASFGLKEIAENGNLGPMVTRLGGSGHVSDVVVAFGGSAPPILPGETVVATITTDRGAKYLSWASMLICTNDGFSGLDGERLPQKVGDAVTLYTEAYDAGTEINTEDFADMVPPCPLLTGVPTSDPGTGASNPALAEGGVIHHHGGIQGGDDLDPIIHGWTGPLARIEVRRTH